MPEPPFPQDEEVSPSNPFLEEEEASRRDARPLERALDMLMITTSRRCPRKPHCSYLFLYRVKTTSLKLDCSIHFFFIWEVLVYQHTVHLQAVKEWTSIGERKYFHAVLHRDWRKCKLDTSIKNSFVKAL